jgi:hypothetical protein
MLGCFMTPLKFPTVRLLVFNRLHSGDSCAEAIVNTSKAIGLISADALNEAVASSACCLMTAARLVFDECLGLSHDGKHPNEKLKADAWETIVAKVNANRHDCDAECDKEAWQGKPMDCCKLAPIVMDVLLQQINMLSGSN